MTSEAPIDSNGTSSPGSNGAPKPAPTPSTLGSLDVRSDEAQHAATEQHAVLFPGSAPGPATQRLGARIKSVIARADPSGTRPLFDYADYVLQGTRPAFE